MTTRILFLVGYLIFCGINSARSQTADEAADAIDLLRYHVTGKIDDDVTITSHAFAQATDLNNALFWSDWLSPFLDIARQVLNGLTLVGGGGPTKHTSQVRQWLHASVEGVDASQKAISIFGSVDRLKQDGENLALAIDGPAYTARIEAMLNRADDVTFFFEYEPYRQSVLNDLLGVSGNPSPLPISRKSTNIDRKGGAIVPTVHEARLFAANQLSALSHQVRNSTLSPSQLQGILSFVNSRRQDVAQSRVGHRQVSYDAMLSDGPTISPVPVAYSLGLIRALENWRIQMLTQFVEDTSVQMRVRTREVANQFVQLTADQLLQKGVKSLNLRLDVEAVVAGQGGANLIAADAASLGFGVALNEALDLADTGDVVFASSSREQVTMLPQHMVDALPGEVSKVLLVVDDTVQYVNSLTVPRPIISSVSPRTLNTMPLGQRQWITITGTGFNANSTLSFNDGTTTFPSNPAHLDYRSTTEIRYNIAVGPNAATWTAKVINGAVESLPYSFYVVSGTKELVGLAVTGPAAISESSSGQFTATALFSDASQQTVTSSTSWMDNSSATTISSSGLLSAGSVSSDTQVTVSATYTTGGITKSASAKVTVVNSVNCGSTIQEKILNGNFANNGNNWTLTGSFRANATFPTCNSCPGYAWMANADGTPGDNLSGTLSQTITIPANATSASLGYYYRITTSETINSAFDVMMLNLVLPGGALVELDRRSNLHANTGYIYRPFDLIAYKGQTITIRFSASTDGNYPTVFRVDDVSVVMSAPNPVTPVLFGVGGPTNVVEGTTAQYSAIVVNCDGSIQSVTPSWSDNSSATTISSSGLLSAGSVTSDRSVTIMATYGSFPSLSYPITVVNAAATYSHLAISGPSSINENGSGQFSASAIFSDGSSQSVSPNWLENSSATSISSGGLLNTGEVGGNTTVTVSASHTIGSVTRNATQEVLILNVPPPVTFTSLSVSGPNVVNENSTAQYTATAHFSDGSSQSINPSWSEDFPTTSISIFGLFSAGEVSTDVPVTISLVHTDGGIVQNASKSVMISDRTPPTLDALQQGNNLILSWNTNAVGFTLEWLTNFMQTNWVPMSLSTAVSGGQYVVTNSMSNGAGFFRLTKP